MEINISEYLSTQRMNEIVEEEFRKIAREKLNSEKEITRIIGNSAYQKAFDILDNSLPEDWKEKVTSDIQNVVNSVASYNVFRYDVISGKPISIGSKFIEQVVSENQDLMREKINQMIDEKLNRDNENYEDFVDRLVDIFYNGFTVKFEK